MEEKKIDNSVSPSKSENDVVIPQMDAAIKELVESHAETNKKQDDIKKAFAKLKDENQNLLKETKTLKKTIYSYTGIMGLILTGITALLTSTETLRNDGWSWLETLFVGVAFVFCFFLFGVIFIWFVFCLIKRSSK